MLKSDNEVADEVSSWQKAVVAYLSGAKPPYHVMKQFFERKWGKFGIVNLCLLKSGVYIVEFEDIEASVHVMDAGPWYFDSRPLIVKPWSTEMSLEREGLENIPIWVKLPGLKLYFRAPYLFSKIGSMIGRPLFTDMMTAKRKRLLYARVCVEIGINDVLPEVVYIKDLDGSVLEQKVEYE